MSAEALRFKALSFQRNAARTYLDARNAAAAGSGGWLAGRRHQRDAAKYARKAREAYAEFAAAVEAEAMNLHVITERVDGPDLDDLVRLIRYLREHDIVYRFEADPSGSTLRWQPSDPASWPHIFEGHTYTRPEGVVFVGPDGTVYDANREAL